MRLRLATPGELAWLRDQAAQAAAASFQAADRWNRDLPWLTWVVEDAAGIAGWCELYNVDPERGSASFGMVLFRSSCGFPRRAFQMLFRVCFELFGLRRIELRLLASQTRLAELAERFGFRTEAVLRQATQVAGEPQDVRVMALFREE